MIRGQLIAPLAFAVLLAVTAADASADVGTQDRKAAEAPEVPVAAALPAAAGASGAVYYLIARFRRGRAGRDE